MQYLLPYTAPKLKECEGCTTKGTLVFQFTSAIKKIVSQLLIVRPKEEVAFKHFFPIFNKAG